MFGVGLLGRRWVRYNPLGLSRQAMGGEGAPRGAPGRNREGGGWGLTGRGAGRHRSLGLGRKRRAPGCARGRCGGVPSLRGSPRARVLAAGAVPRGGRRNGLEISRGRGAVGAHVRGPASPRQGHRSRCAE
jgi:hypothetical protein